MRRQGEILSWRKGYSLNEIEKNARLCFPEQKEGTWTLFNRSLRQIFGDEKVVLSKCNMAKIVDDLEGRDMAKTTFKNHLFNLKKLYNLYNRQAHSCIEAKLDEVFTDLRSKVKYSLSAKDEKNWLTDEEISSIKTRLSESKDWYDFQRLLIMKLYTEMAPLRRDYCVVGYDSELCDNVLDTEKGTIILKKYKTSDVYGQKVITLPEDILKDVQEWYRIRTDQGIDSPWLLITKQGCRMNENSFTNFVKGISKDKILTVNLFRKMYATKNTDFEYEEKMNNIADGMCHSRGTSASYYQKQI